MRFGKAVKVSKKARSSHYSLRACCLLFSVVLIWRSETALSGLPGDAARLDCSSLETPDAIHVLPDALEEVSGITDVSSSEVAVVQDEKGTIFLYNLESRKITRQIQFGPDGDYEGITHANDAIYVLESNGFLHRVEKWLEGPIVTKIKLDLPTKDNEGLGFDSSLSQLLIAPKSRWKKGKESKNLRPIFAYDLRSNLMSKTPLLVLDLSNMNPRSGSTVRAKDGRKVKRPKFRPASLAVSPISQELFVLSATDRILASFDRKGVNTGHCDLPEKLFPKPEGITFLPDKSLIISNEANGKKPTLVIYSPKAKNR